MKKGRAERRGGKREEEMKRAGFVEIGFVLTSFFFLIFLLIPSVKWTFEAVYYSAVLHQYAMDVEEQIYGQLLHTDAEALSEGDIRIPDAGGVEFESTERGGRFLIHMTKNYRSPFLKWEKELGMDTVFEFLHRKNGLGME